MPLLHPYAALWCRCYLTFSYAECAFFRWLELLAFVHHFRVDPLDVLVYCIAPPSVASLFYQQGAAILPPTWPFHSTTTCGYPQLPDCSVTRYGVISTNCFEQSPSWFHCTTPTPWFNDRWPGRWALNVCAKRQLGVNGLSGNVDLKSPGMALGILFPSFSCCYVDGTGFSTVSFLRYLFGMQGGRKGAACFGCRFQTTQQTHKDSFRWDKK